jgi:protein ImuB
MQRWQAARQSLGAQAPVAARSGQRLLPCDALYPPWLLREPLRLEVRGEKPHYQGPLRLLAGPQRLETGWWDSQPQATVSRDYFIARSEGAGLLWVYRERLARGSGGDADTAPVRWFLQGIYA